MQFLQQNQIGTAISVKFVDHLSHLLTSTERLLDYARQGYGGGLGLPEGPYLWRFPPRGLGA